MAIGPSLKAPSLIYTADRGIPSSDEDPQQPHWPQSDVIDQEVAESFALRDSRQLPVLSEERRDPMRGSSGGIPPSSLFAALEQEYTALNHGRSLLEADNSDEEEHLEKPTHFPSLVHLNPPSCADMTVESSYCGRKVRFKGNQLILWARDMMEKVVKAPERETKIAAAIATRHVTIRSSNDWLDYEGMFDAFGHLLAKPSPTFRGVATIVMGGGVSTTVEFKEKKGQAGLLYAHIHDPKLIDYLTREFPEYDPSLGIFPRADYGLSYREIVKIIQWMKRDRLERYDKKGLGFGDAELAQRQLSLLKGSAEGPFTSIDRFLTYFNAILFGSEISRNSLSFVTGVMVLSMIGQQKLTYPQSFQSPDWPDISKKRAVSYAVYPMASPYAGEGNFKAYKKLMDISQQELAKKQLSSEIGMKASRKRSQWAQIQIKEAILFKFWTKDWTHEPGGLYLPSTTLGNGWVAEEHGHAVEFARRFNEGIIRWLHQYFPRVPKLLVYSPDEQYSLGWFKPSAKVWKDPSNPDSTETDFNAIEWYITDAQPLLLEKVLHDAMDNIEMEMRADLAEYEEGSMEIDRDEDEP